MADKIHEDVKEFYGKQLGDDPEALETNRLHTATQCMTDFIREKEAKVHEEILEKYYGCGLVMPEKLEGMKVLDLGCGSGRDCYLLSQIVGEYGHVTGIDMTEDMIELAEKYVNHHMKVFGYQKPNVDFKLGYIESLEKAGIQHFGHYDAVVSNCVINLSPDKAAVLAGANKALKVGGELHFSDVYADRVLPTEVRENMELWENCIGGAMHWEELVKAAKEAGFSTPRLVNASELRVEKKELRDIVGDAKFVSATYRLYKLPPQLMAPCQVKYQGTIPNHTNSYEFDHVIHFKTDELVHVDAEVATILLMSRYRDDFEFVPYTMEIDADPFKMSQWVSGLSYPEVEVTSHDRHSCRRCSKTPEPPAFNTPGCV